MKVTLSYMSAALSRGLGGGEEGRSGCNSRGARDSRFEESRTVEAGARGEALIGLRKGVGAEGSGGVEAVGG